MKTTIAILASALLLSACATSPTGAVTPTAQTVQQIQQACLVDAGIRPIVTALLAVPGLATVQEVAAVAAARQVIDPICANPAGSIQANTMTILTQNINTVTSLLGVLNARNGG